MMSNPLFNFIRYLHLMKMINETRYSPRHGYEIIEGLTLQDAFEFLGFRVRVGQAFTFKNLPGSFPKFCLTSPNTFGFKDSKMMVFHEISSFCLADLSLSEFSLRTLREEMLCYSGNFDLSMLDDTITYIQRKVGEIAGSFKEESSLKNFDLEKICLNHKIETSKKPRINYDEYKVPVVIDLSSYSVRSEKSKILLASADTKNTAEDRRKYFDMLEKKRTLERQDVSNVKKTRVEKKREKREKNMLKRFLRAEKRLALDTLSLEEGKNVPKLTARSVIRKEVKTEVMIEPTIVCPTSRVQVDDRKIQLNVAESVTSSVSGKVGFTLIEDICQEMIKESDENVVIGVTLPKKLEISSESINGKSSPTITILDSHLDPFDVSTVITRTSKAYDFQLPLDESEIVSYDASHMFNFESYEQFLQLETLILLSKCMRVISNKFYKISYFFINWSTSGFFDMMSLSSFADRFFRENNVIDPEAQFKFLRSVDEILDTQKAKLSVRMVKRACVQMFKQGMEEDEDLIDEIFEDAYSDEDFRSDFDKDIKNKIGKIKTFKEEKLQTNSYDSKFVGISSKDILYEDLLVLKTFVIEDQEKHEAELKLEIEKASNNVNFKFLILKNSLLEIII